jgi:hypothetical protein
MKHAAMTGSGGGDAFAAALRPPHRAATAKSGTARAHLRFNRTDVVALPLAGGARPPGRNHGTPLAGYRRKFSVRFLKNFIAPPLLLFFNRTSRYLPPLPRHSPPLPQHLPPLPPWRPSVKLPSAPGPVSFVGQSDAQVCNIVV